MMIDDMVLRSFMDVYVHDGWTVLLALVPLADDKTYQCSRSLQSVSVKRHWCLLLMRSAILLALGCDELIIIQMLSE